MPVSGASCQASAQRRARPTTSRPNAAERTARLASPAGALRLSTSLLCSLSLADNWPAFGFEADTPRAAAFRAEERLTNRGRKLGMGIISSRLLLVPAEYREVGKQCPSIQCLAHCIMYRVLLPGLTVQ